MGYVDFFEPAASGLLSERQAEICLPGTDLTMPSNSSVITVLALPSQDIPLRLIPMLLCRIPKTHPNRMFYVGARSEQGSPKDGARVVFDKHIYIYIFVVTLTCCSNSLPLNVAIAKIHCYLPIQRSLEASFVPWGKALGSGHLGPVGLQNVAERLSFF